MTASNSNATNAATSDLTPVFHLAVAAFSGKPRSMKSTRVKAAMRRCLTAACLLAALAPNPGQAQISALKKVVETQSPAPTPTPEQTDETRERLEQWLHDARETLTRLEAPGAAAALPAGISAEELEDRRRDLEQMVLTAARSLKNLPATADARKDLETTRAEDTAWTGFKEKPPYPLVMVDDLLNERDATIAKLASYESSATNSGSLLASAMDDTKAAEETVSKLIVELQNAEDEERDAAKWRLEAARGKSRMLAERAGFLQNRCDSLKDRIAATKTDLSLLDRKIKIAKASSHFNEDDLAKIAKNSNARKQAIQKEIAAISKQLKTAVADRTQAQTAVDALTPKAATDREPDGLDLAKYKLEVAGERVDAKQSIIEGLESLVQLENLSLTANQNRRAILTATSPKERTKALESLGALRERLWAWTNVTDDEISDCVATLNKLEARTSSISPDDPRSQLLNDQRAITGEKLAMLQRVAQMVMTQRRLVKRWDIEFAPQAVQPGLLARISTLGHSGWNSVRKIWSFEIMSFKDNVEVDGRTITGKIPITLGLLLRALLFFLVGYWISAFFANRIESTIVTRGHIAEAQARTLRNWAMIVVGVLLAITTLALLKIPLTVFAFLGGALAIGLGFGMQTLIKNFVSGIIVLAERKVRLGDIVDVDGIVGTVTEINTRSSVVRSPDDVETMIPNSLFLENRVTNWTLTSPKMRRHLRVGVAYGSPPAKVMDILTESAARHGLICKEPAPFAVLDDFGDNALAFQLYFWLELKPSTNAVIVTSDLRLMIEKRFAETGIRLPFPQRDLHLSTESPLQLEWVKEER